MSTATAHQDTFFSRIPENERRFLVGQGSEILAKAKPGSLESILQETAKVFSEKDYGWEEAILDRLWLRWPHEIREQIFCSENALKNYLLLRAMRLPVRYAVVHNWRKSGMPHDIVLVQGGKGTYMVDWEGATLCHILPDALVSYKLTGTKKHPVYTNNSRDIVFMERLEFLTEQQVIDRVYAARSGQSFMDSIMCGQHLFIRRGEDGEAKAFIKYDPARQALEFLCILTPLFGLPFYVSNVLTARNGMAENDIEIGIARELNELNTEKVPLISSNNGSGLTVAKDSELERALSDEEMGELGLQLIYQLAPKEQDGYFSSKESRDFVLNMPMKEVPDFLRLKEVGNFMRMVMGTYLFVGPDEKEALMAFFDDNPANDGTSNEAVIGSFFHELMEAFGRLRKTSPGAAERLADYLTACLVIKNEFKSLGDMLNHVDKSLAEAYSREEGPLAEFGIENPQASAKALYFVTINSNKLGKLLQAGNGIERVTLVHRRLGEELVKRLGVNYSSSPIFAIA